MLLIGLMPYQFFCAGDIANISLIEIEQIKFDKKNIDIDNI